MEWLGYIREALARHPARIIEPGDRAHAAVAMILEEQPDGPRVLFIERSADENDRWSGQIAFPGGRTEGRDASARHTAERETREELGLDLATARYVGRLNDISPGSLKIVVSCFVYVVTHHPLLSPDDREIADAFWVPVREFNNPARRAHVDVAVRGRLRRFPALRLGKEQPLWGITYRLLRNFNKVVRDTADPHLRSLLSGQGGCSYPKR